MKKECCFIKGFFKNIFSVCNYGETHYIVRVFGIKIKFPKLEYAKKKRQNLYYYYKKNNIDITTLPPAEGQIRDIQLANLALLKEMDYVCRQAGLKYWLDFGTLLGAVRHKGFVPWDDDIDTSMLRDDYDKIIEAFKKYSRNPDIFADYVNSEKNTCQCYIKVQHRELPQLFVDIFPYDYYGKVLSEAEQDEKTKEIRKIRKKMQARSTSKNIRDVLAIVEQERANFLRENKVQENSDLVLGIDFNHSNNNWFFHQELIYPLKEISFEGEKFSCPNSVDAYLTHVFGNYMDYPKKIGVGHNMYANISEEEANKIKSLIEGVV